MIVLEKRPQPSKAWSYATPLVAVLATMVFGGILFALLGKNPIEPSAPFSGSLCSASSRFTIARNCW